MKSYFYKMDNKSFLLACNQTELSFHFVFVLRSNTFSKLKISTVKNGVHKGKIQKCNFLAIITACAIQA